MVPETRTLPPWTTGLGIYLEKVFEGGMLHCGGSSYLAHNHLRKGELTFAAGAHFVKTITKIPDTSSSTVRPHYRYGASFSTFWEYTGNAKDNNGHDTKLALQRIWKGKTKDLEVFALSNMVDWWTIWKERNARIFYSKKESVISIKYRCQSSIVFWCNMAIANDIDAIHFLGSLHNL